MQPNDPAARLIGHAIAEISAASAKVDALTVPPEQTADKLLATAHLRVAGGLLAAIVPPAA